MWLFNYVKKSKRNCAKALASLVDICTNINQVWSVFHPYRHPLFVLIMLMSGPAPVLVLIGWWEMIG